MYGYDTARSASFAASATTLDPREGNKVTFNLRGASSSGKIIKRTGLRIRVETAPGTSCWAEIKDVTSIDDAGSAPSQVHMFFFLCVLPAA